MFHVKNVDGTIKLKFIFHQVLVRFLIIQSLYLEMNILMKRNSSKLFLIANFALMFIEIPSKCFFSIIVLTYCDFVLLYILQYYNFFWFTVVSKSESVNILFIPGYLSV